MAVAGNNLYPSIQTVLDLVRSLVLDDMAGATDTVGEGQIYVDDMAVSVTLSNFFNKGIEDLCRDLRTTNAPMLIRDNVLLLGLPPVNSSLGLAAPNPAVQCYVNFAGYFDGTQMHPSLLLPQDFYMPIMVSERLTGSNGEFDEVSQTGQGLPSCNQGSKFGRYEWRQDGIYLNGALTTRDLKLRYWSTLVDLYTKGVDLSTTYIPIKGCKSALADKIVVSIARRISPERLADAKMSAKESLFSFLNEQAQQKQGLEYETQAFGSESGPQLGF